MKTTKTSFLYFYIIISLFANDNLFAQQQEQQIDSIKYYVDLAENANNHLDAKKSFDFFDNRLKLYQDNNQVLGQVSILITIAKIQKNLGMIYESEGTAIKAKKLLDELPYDKKQDRSRVSLYNHLGILYKKNKNFKPSLEYYKKALVLVKNPKHRITAISNIANVYREQGDYVNAINLYENALEKSLVVGDIEQKARILNNIGQTQSLMHNPNAIDNLEKALSLRQKLNYNRGIISSYMSLGEHFERNGDTLKAFSYTEKALAVSSSLIRVDEKIETFELQFDLKYFDNYKKYKVIKDSVDNARNLSKHLYASIKYDNQKAIEKASKSELEKVILKEKNTRQLFIFFIVFLFSIFLYFSIKSKHKKEKVKQVYLKETELSKKVHDEIANDMSDVMGFIEHEIELPADKKDMLLNKIEDLYLRTRNISTETASINLTNFDKSLSNLLLQHNNEGTKVVINDINTIDWNNVPDHKKTVVYRCLQELLINMKKHSKAKLVSLMFKEDNRKKKILYVDDGIGFSEEEVTLNGLQNVESRINSIQGTFSFTTSKGNGFKATLKFKS